MNKNIEEEWNFIVSKKNQKNKNCEISKMRNKNDYNPELFCSTYYNIISRWFFSNSMEK